MCGIAGIISHKRISEDHLKSMSTALQHRGPDGYGYMLYSEHDGLNIWLNQELPENSCGNHTVAFAHRRLSIIDLSSASLQPMTDEAKSCCLVYNGEIYNYLELKAELERLGCSFKTTGDAEVVLQAYQTWGGDCFRRFNGMWALALLDRQNRCIVFSRDRFGIKPLYYTIVDNMFMFASEINSLLANPTVRCSPNERVVAKYLLTGLVDDTAETFFEGICSFPAAHWACVPLHSETHSLQPISYWSFPNSAFTGKEQDAVQCFRELFINSIRLHTRSDVPVGTCLSGGLDSSSIVCTSEQLRKANQIPRYAHQAFGYCSSDERYSEKKFMDEVVTATSVNMHYVSPEEEQVLSCLPAIVYAQAEPFGSASILAQWFVFQRAKQENIKVMLDGQGADETLAGYHTYFATIARMLLANRDIFTYISLRNQYQKSIGPFPVSYTDLVASVVPRQLYSTLATTLRPFLKHTTPQTNVYYLLRESMSPSILSSYLGDTPQSDEPKLSLDLVLQRDVKSTSLPALLRYEDRNSMAHSIEARVPFLDYRLVDFLFTLPDHWRVNGIWTKYILREAMNGILPESIRTRIDKIGFKASPSITFNYIQDNFASLVNSETDLERQWLNKTGVERIFRNVSELTSGDFILWRFLNLKLWARQHWGHK